MQPFELGILNPNYCQSFFLASDDTQIYKWGMRTKFIHSRQSELILPWRNNKASEDSQTRSSVFHCQVLNHMTGDVHSRRSGEVTYCSRRVKYAQLRLELLAELLYLLSMNCALVDDQQNSVLKVELKMVGHGLIRLLIQAYAQHCRACQ